MTLVLGVDPGAHGAFAVVDSQTRKLVSVRRMPTWVQVVGSRGSKRERIDPIALAEMFETFKLMGVGLIVQEAVGGYGKQPGSSGFVFGFGVGLVYMSAVYMQLPMETVAPQTWKAMLRVPGKNKADDTAIVQRACELFPDSRADFHGARGGKLVDVAEAAMIGLWGVDHVLKSGAVTLDPMRDLVLRTRAADVGA